MTKKTQRKPAQPAKEDPPKKDTVTIRLSEDDKAVLAALHLRTGICSAGKPMLP